MNALTNIGLNLTHDSFDADRDAVLERAQAAGVARFIVTGTTVTHSAKALELARTQPGRLYATAGVHPHYAQDYDDHTSAALRDLVRSPEVIAVGECGLDFCRNFSPAAAQTSAFAAQLELAAETGLPVFLHQRDALEPFLEMLGAIRDRLSGGVAHCFTGGIDELEPLLELDLYIGITGWLCDERRGGALRDAAAHIPMDRVLIETDAPYLMPRNLPEKPKTRRNEPVHLPHILRELAAALGKPADEVARATQENTARLFRLDS
jgi:TatD DNase family protein